MAIETITIDETVDETRGGECCSARRQEGRVNRCHQPAGTAWHREPEVPSGRSALKALLSGASALRACQDTNDPQTLCGGTLR
jgi:hypothetical protein